MPETNCTAGSLLPLFQHYVCALILQDPLFRVPYLHDSQDLGAASTLGALCDHQARLPLARSIVSSALGIPPMSAHAHASSTSVASTCHVAHVPTHTQPSSHSHSEFLHSALTHPSHVNTVPTSQLTLSSVRRSHLFLPTATMRLRPSRYFAKLIAGNLNKHICQSVQHRRGTLSHAHTSNFLISRRSPCPRKTNRLQKLALRRRPSRSLRFGMLASTPQRLPLQALSLRCVAALLLQACIP
jgi:hypothetical protein